jgi:hypothetical protein
MKTIEKYIIYRTLNAFPIFKFEDYLISRDGKLYYLNPETSEVKDISDIIFDYTKKGVPVYRIIDLKDSKKFLEIKLDKLVLNNFIGDLEGKIIHKDENYTNCNLDNLCYESNITRIDDNTLWINNKEFRCIASTKNYNKAFFISNDGVIYSTHTNKNNNGFVPRYFDKANYYNTHINNVTMKIHRLIYSSWAGIIPKDYTINHEDGDKHNNYYKNLTLMTNHENVMHAHNNGLKKDARWTEANVHTMCKMMEVNIPFKKISEYFNVSGEKEIRSLRTILHYIKNNTIWKNISSLYKLDCYDTELFKKVGMSLSYSTIEEIYILIADGYCPDFVSNKYDIPVEIIERLKKTKSWKICEFYYNKYKNAA